MSFESVAQDQLKAFVRRIESLEDEIKVLNEDKSEVYAEAKGNGFDKKVLRKVVAARRQDHAERMEQDALFELYWNAVHDIAHAHVEIIEEFDPETGEVVPATANGGDHETSAEPELVNLGRRQQPYRALSGADADEHQHPQPVETHIAPVESAADEISTFHSEPEMARPPAISEAGDGNSADSSPAAVPVVPSNVTPIRSHNPATHFLNSEGLLRLHGCLKADRCGGTWRALCFDCSRLHDGPTAQNGAA